MRSYDGTNMPEESEIIRLVSTLYLALKWSKLKSERTDGQKRSGASDLRILFKKT